ncbi:MAG: hypothetical protein CM1200mP2_23510 [Planctomycetaceae bacterium]|nr:MAG: hypothetical protein CM1200mP2_23510 [Planctomycetaceae bacterium]
MSKSRRSNVIITAEWDFLEKRGNLNPSHIVQVDKDHSARANTNEQSNTKSSVRRGLRTGPSPRPQAGPDELLSSYLDGELSADEIVAVEAHLEVSEESRRALEDLRSLSNYLSSFPVEPIPESPVVSAAASKDEAPGTPTRRLPLIAAAVAAAVLVILAAVPGDPESRPTTVASHNAATPEQDQPSAEADTHLVQPDSADQLVAGSGLGSDEVAGGGLVLPKSLDKAQVGQILSAVDFSDGDAVVVRLTVVDIEQGLDSLRLLLQKHHIARADAIASASEDRTGRNCQGDSSPRRITWSASWSRRPPSRSPTRCPNCAARCRPR